MTETPETGPTTADIQLIQRILPHRYPFLLVDRVIDIDGTKSATGLKNVTMNEPHFQGHFPGTPIMPGASVSSAAGSNQTSKRPWVISRSGGNTSV